MTLNKERWLVRWFFWSLGIVDEFTGNDRTWRVEERGTNLCLFCQTIALWAPLVLLAQLVVVSLIVFVALIGPVMIFGFGGYAIGIGGIIGILLFVAAISALVGWLKKRGEGKPRTPRRVSDEPGAPSLFWQFLVAQKQKVCPMITFNGSAS